MVDKNNFINSGQTDISIYLNQIRKLKVMTPKREKEIAGMILSQQLSDEELAILKNEVICGNLRFVISVCKSYQNQGIDLADLISEGNYGLMKAFENFNWDRDIRFISYGRWWIKQAVLEALNKNSRTIRVPVNIIQEYLKVRKKVDDLTLDNKQGLNKSVCLDNKITEGGDTFNDFLHDKESSDFTDLDSKNQMINKLYDIMAQLDDREKFIVETYFGVGCDSKNLEEIGIELNLTKERVRQIKEKAIRKLRNETIDLFDFI